MSLNKTLIAQAQDIHTVPAADDERLQLKDFSTTYICERLKRVKQHCMVDLFDWKENEIGVFVFALQLFLG